MVDIRTHSDVEVVCCGPATPITICSIAQYLGGREGGGRSEEGEEREEGEEGEQ